MKCYDGMRIFRGKKVSMLPRISLVVMSVDSDPNALLAIGSISGSDVEKILVNTGKGSFLGEEGLEDVILVEDEIKRLPGGTRNLGIKFSTGPIIAFMAADCVMSRENLERRIAAHEKGFYLVSSTLRPFSDSIASWASYIYLHKNRMPEFQRAPASVFGVSYKSNLFSEVGIFNEGMRIAEDADFNNRCLDFPTYISREIVTLHRYPEKLSDSCYDIAIRSVREMKFRNRRGIRQAKSELFKSIRLSFSVILKKNVPRRARIAALTLPILGLSAILACLFYRPDAVAPDNSSI